MIVLVLNSGSSSVKWQVRELDGAASPAAGVGTVLARGAVERIGSGGPADHTEALGALLGTLDAELDGRAVDAVGHRVVHGGERFSAPVRLDDEVVAAIEDLAALAPLHNPAGVLGIRAVTEHWPDVAQVAVFDTSFHATMPERAWRYAVPDEVYRRTGLRRYGFHGSSYAHVAARAADHLGVAAFTGVIAHLGNGASVCAVRDGESIDTSMGLTPLEGLVMGTRSGDLDPGAVTFLQRAGHGAAEVDELLNRRSGLLGLAGDSDVRTLTERAAAGDGTAELALEIAAYRLAKYVGGYHVAVGGMPALVLTGGIGEHSAPFRARLLDLLTPLGIAVDPARNEAGPDAEVRVVSTATSAVPVLVVRTDEEGVIAAATAHLVGAAA